MIVPIFINIGMIFKKLNLSLIFIVYIHVVSFYVYIL